MPTESRTRSLARGLAALLVLGPGALSLVAPSPSARAEGSAELGIQQGLIGSTPLRVDIVDPGGEEIVWTGMGDVTVIDPGGTVLGTYASGETILPTPATPGAYRVQLARDQFDSSGGSQVSAFYPWDVTVYAGGEPRPGRLWSPLWSFNAGAYGEAAAADASLYGLVSGGAAGETAVIELAFSGLAGWVHQVPVGRAGVQLGDRRLGWSVPYATGVTVPAEVQVYLNRPELATDGLQTPTVSQPTFRGGPTGCIFLAPGSTTAAFTFETDVSGTFHLTCDLDQDGTFDLTSAADLNLQGLATPGTNIVAWEGRDRAGLDVPPGAYLCRVQVMVGELHYVASDVETSFPGLRMFHVAASGDRTPLRMYWDDALVQASDIVMPNGDHGAPTSGPLGVDSELYAIPAAPHGVSTAGNARAWGAFTSQGKGNDAHLDTYTWLAQATSDLLELQVLDPSADLDADGLTDYVERCVSGTDPEASDSDADGIPDAVESGSATPIDTDGDGLVDALDPDDDGDGTPTLDEDRDGDGDPTNDDLDGDGTPDYLDADDQDGPLGDTDGDGILNQDDLCPGAWDPAQADLDADGQGDACDLDVDGDGTPGDADCDDHDPAIQSTATFYRDADDDGIGDASDPIAICALEVPAGYSATSGDNCPEIANPGQEDRDADGIGDACDLDVDGDGVPGDQDCDDRDPDVSVTQTFHRDADGDGRGDPADATALCDATPPAGWVLDDTDNCPDVANADQDDADGDGLGDACDDDADGDGVPVGVDCDERDPATGAATVYHRDQDGDGYGDPGDATALCDATPPAGWVLDDTDNCPDVANADQDDADGDGLGDACDDDTRPPAGDDGCGCSAGSRPGRGLALTWLLVLGWVLRRRRRAGSVPRCPGDRGPATGD